MPRSTGAPSLLGLPPGLEGAFGPEPAAKGRTGTALVVDARPAVQPRAFVSTGPDRSRRGANDRYGVPQSSASSLLVARSTMPGDGAAIVQGLLPGTFGSA
ncbi:MAG TPA: hypothetical protein VJ820_11665 [Propionibacteriaceae bacterium]|nr:hypothetical protein [Propionibacteriaceae bacterium]